jgi:protein CMS1
MSDASELKSQLLQPTGGDAQEAATTQNKRKRKREKEKANRQLSERAKTVKLDNRTLRPSQPIQPAKSEKIDGSIAQMDPSLAADYISQRLRKFEKELSAVELEDRFIPARAFLDTTSYNNSRTLTNLPEYLEKCELNLFDERQTCIGV